MTQQLGVSFSLQTSAIGILNVAEKKYLAVGIMHCEDHIDVTLNDRNNEWTLTQKGNNFRITSNSGRNCYDLFAGSEYGSDRRRVFCRKNPNLERCWQFESVGDGKFLIKDTEHNQYLYAVELRGEPGQSNISKYYVLTSKGCRRDYESDPKYLWRLENDPPNAADPNEDISQNFDAIGTVGAFLPAPGAQIAEIAQAIGNLFK